MRLGNSVPHARSVADNTPPHLRCTRQQMLDLFEGRLSPEQAHRQGLLTADALEQLLALLTTFRQDVSRVLPCTDTARTSGIDAPLRGDAEKTPKRPVRIRTGRFLCHGRHHAACGLISGRPWERAPHPWS